MVGGEKERAQTTGNGHREEGKEKQDVQFFIEIDLSCCNLASWWVPPSVINPVYIILTELATLHL
jgi:hypothetical protein